MVDGHSGDNDDSELICLLSVGTSEDVGNEMERDTDLVVHPLDDELVIVQSELRIMLHVPSCQKKWIAPIELLNLNLVPKEACPAIKIPETARIHPDNEGGIRHWRTEGSTLWWPNENFVILRTIVRCVRFQ
jgi:hypothetical protein